jgi:hypothetical protein
MIHALGNTWWRYLLGVFIALQVFFTLHQVEYFPFFLFGFFSDELAPEQVYFEIRQGNQVLEMPTLTNEFVQNQLHFADFLRSEQGRNEGMKALIHRRIAHPIHRKWARDKLLPRWKEEHFRQWLGGYLNKRGLKGRFRVYRVVKKTKSHSKTKEYVFAC